LLICQGIPEVIPKVIPSFSGAAGLCRIGSFFGHVRIFVIEQEVRIASLPRERPQVAFVLQALQEGQGIIHVGLPDDGPDPYHLGQQLVGLGKDCINGSRSALLIGQPRSHASHLVRRRFSP